MKAKIMDASHLLIILSEQEALRLGLNSISVDIPTTLSKITLAKVFLEGCKYTGFSYSEAENITIRALSIRDGTFVLLFSVHIPNMSRIKSSFQRKKFRIKETTATICVSISKLYRHDGRGGTTLYGRHYLSKSEIITFWR
ncbi:MAG: hypothetical protein ACLTE2_00810 [Eubacteriales bacterium]